MGISPLRQPHHAWLLSQLRLNDRSDEAIIQISELRNDSLWQVALALNLQILLSDWPAARPFRPGWRRLLRARRYSCTSHRSRGRPPVPLAAEVCVGLPPASAAKGLTWIEIAAGSLATPAAS